MEILAYALFILILAAPFIVAVLGVSGIVIGLGLAVTGIQTGSWPRAAVGLALAAACAVGLALAWRWFTTAQIGEARLTKVADVTAEMRARPRIFHLGWNSSSEEAVRLLLAEGHFDGAAGERRHLPVRDLQKNPPATAAGEWWGEWFLIAVKDSDCVRRTPLKGDLTACLTSTALPQRPREPHFSINERNETNGRNYRLYYRSGDETTELYRCEIDVRRPPLQMSGGVFEQSDDYALAMKRLNACRTEMLTRFVQDLG